jgi:pimeloyl-ACP methyl ester carboxylesterase
MRKVICEVKPSGFLPGFCPALVFWFSALLLFSLSSTAQAATVCEAATRECQEHLSLDGGKFLVVYRNYPLTSPNETIERVFVLVHGVGRDGNSYFRSAVAATREAGRMESTLVIAPQFHATDSNCKDKIEPGEALFSCRGWSGGIGTRAVPRSTFTAVDTLVKFVADRTRFPKLKEIVVAGHSAGGQFVQRYAGFNRIDGKLAVPVRYVTANPSSYVYLETWRPVENPGKDCPDFDRYKFGLQEMSGYMAQTGAEAVRMDYPKRNVTYLLGELDTTDEHNLDKTCPAMAQGPNRLARGLAFYGRLQEKFPSVHKLVKVPGCAHSADCMFRSEAARRVVFAE